jgi:hypothetical protein
MWSGFSQSRHFDLHLLPAKCYTLLGVVTDFLFSPPGPLLVSAFAGGVIFCTILKLVTGDRRGADGKLDFGTWEQIFAENSPVCVINGYWYKLSENERMKLNLVCK